VAPRVPVLRHCLRWPQAHLLTWPLPQLRSVECSMLESLMIPLIKAPPFSLVKMDACEWLSTLSDGSIDLIITDIAYESIEKHRAIGTTTRLKNWFKTFPNTRVPELFQHLYRVMKKNSHLYFFCDHETMFLAKPIGEEVGFTFWNPIVWDKVHIGGGYHYRRQKEFILFFEKGKRKLADAGIGDVLRHPRITDDYPTRKPQALVDTLVSQSSTPGETVIDPFFGSGTVAASALSQGRSFMGSDISPEAHRVAKERLSIYYQ